MENKIKLKSLYEYIKSIDNKQEEGYCSKEFAYDNIVEYSSFINTPLTLEMFIGDKKLFEGNFEESDCWEYGCDHHLEGKFVKIINPSHGYEDFVVHIKGKTIGWWIDIFSHWAEPTEYAIKKYNLKDSLNILS